ncbi:MAG: LysE family translocator [Thiohalobacterales bacterium]|nr:LysE family translocator [Thiohalobacterales bacterium]
MIPVDVLAGFAGISLLLCIAPGPDNLFVLAQSALYGRMAGIRVTLGLCTGLVVHTAVVALGIAALIRTTPLAYDALRFAGAAWLLYLAWQAFRAAPADMPAGGAQAPDGWRLYRRGIIMNVTNPKVTLFFLALLPQFTDPARGPVLMQIVLLGVIFMLSTLLVFGLVAILAGSIGRWLGRTPRAQYILHVLAGIVFIGLAVRLLLSDL